MAISGSRVSVTNGNEKQTVTITGTPTGGDFTLTYAGQTTTAIAYDADNAAVDAALEALSNIGAGEVTVTGGPGPGTPFVVEFTAGLGRADRVLMTADGTGLTGGSSPAVAVTETQKGGVTEVVPRQTTASQAIIKNIGSAAIDLGGSDVVSGSGYGIGANDIVEVDLEAGETLYGIVATTAVIAQVLVSGK